MKNLPNKKQLKWSLISGVTVGLIAMLLTVSLATAAPLPQDTQPHPTADAQSCGECHLDIANSWSQSPHAHALDDANFQQRWQALGQPGDCLLCHTTNYQATTGEYDAAGVSCEACHGKIDPNHPPAATPIRADTEYCGTCHTTTLAEWRLTGHAKADVGCTDCHDPHSQKPLFEDPDEMCINCHKDSMGPYLEDLHAQKGIGCVDCHELVIPPDNPPADGIVPTGHTFTITPETCVACHTDALHAGFSLPGYENGAKTAQGAITEGEARKVEQAGSSFVNSPEEQIQTLENQVQVLSASSASRNMTILFQGGVVGLVLGGSTAWVVASNVRGGRKEEEDEDEDEEE
jgi:predicted CXXCH cytochrome family protein